MKYNHFIPSNNYINKYIIEKNIIENNKTCLEDKDCGFNSNLRCYTYDNLTNWFDNTNFYQYNDDNNINNYELLNEQKVNLLKINNFCSCFDGKYGYNCQSFTIYEIIDVILILIPLIFIIIIFCKLIRYIILILINPKINNNINKFNATFNAALLSSTSMFLNILVFSMYLELEIFTDTNFFYKRKQYKHYTYEFFWAWIINVNFTLIVVSSLHIFKSWLDVVMQNRLLRKTNQSNILNISYNVWRNYILTAIEIYICIQTSVLVALKKFILAYMLSFPFVLFLGLVCIYASTKIKQILLDIEKSNSKIGERYSARDKSNNSKDSKTYLQKVLNSIKITSRLFLISLFFGAIGAVILIFQNASPHKLHPETPVTIFVIGNKFFLCFGYFGGAYTFYYYLHPKLEATLKKQYKKKQISQKTKTELISKNMMKSNNVANIQKSTIISKKIHSSNNTSQDNKS